MSFWNVNTEEPLRQFRWYIIFGGKGMQSISYALKKTDKPKAKVSTVQHKYLNHYFNFPGRLEWEDINITFAAVAEPNGSKVLMDVLRQSGYGVPSKYKTDDKYEVATIGKKKMNNSVGTVDIVQIDPDGETREKWTLNNPLFTSVQFGALDYGSEEIVELSCTIKYDWAVLTTVDSKPDKEEFGKDNAGRPGLGGYATSPAEQPPK